MASTRTKKIWSGKNRSGDDAGGRAYSQRKARKAKAVQAAEPAQPTRAEKARAAREQKSLQEQKERYRRDIKAFYCETLASKKKVEKRTGKSHGESLGAIHDVLFDFMNLPDLKKKPKVQGPKSKVQKKVLNGPGSRRDAGATELATYSILPELLPDRDPETGDYKERWIYFPTVESLTKGKAGHKQAHLRIEIQDGRDGPISTRLQNELVQGVVVCIRGSGRYQGIYLPRLHLKSELAVKAWTAWCLANDPSERHMLRSTVDDLAQRNLGGIATHWESNGDFINLYGTQGPPEKRELPWNTEMMGLKYEGRRDKDPSVWTAGVGTDATGWHFEVVTLDDIVGEGNVSPGERVKVRDRVSNLIPILETGAWLRDIGTFWEDDDAHRMFVDPEFSEFGGETSFILATILDGDTRVEVSKHFTPNGYGKPLWPEKFDMREIARKRSKDDRKWFSQYFNQFHGTSLRNFAKEWLQYYEEPPRAIAKRLKLNLYIAFDPTSGKKDQKKADYFSGMVWGQTPDRELFYLLDGIREKLPAASVAKALVNLVLKWRDDWIAYKGTAYRVAFEESAYTNYLKVLLDNELSGRGVDAAFAFETIDNLTGGGKEKDRIRGLAGFFEDRRVWIPRTLMKQPSPGSKTHELYDLVKIFESEYLSFPSIPNDDVLDASEMCIVQLAPLRSYRERPAEAKAPTPWEQKEPGAYQRGETDRGPAERMDDALDDLLGHWGRNDWEE